MHKQAFVLAFFLAGLGAALLFTYLRRFEAEVSGGEMVELLTILKPVARGVRVNAAIVGTRTVPRAYVEARAVKVTERDKVIGLNTAIALHPQETLLWTDLAIKTEDRDLSALVQPGKRGVTVKAGGSEANDGNDLIRPGDYVDVISTLGRAGSREEESSIVLLQRILVLAVGDDTEPTRSADLEAAGTSRRNKEKYLTLSLNLQQAQLLSLATSRGRLSVAVRNPDDPTIHEDLPDVKASALSEVEARAIAQRSPIEPGSSGPQRIETSKSRGAR